jgi:predicted nucleic acid-binding protein
MIAVDTNVVAYLLIEGERTAAARELWEIDPDWRLPPLWRAEFLNVLATSHRAGILSADQARRAWHVAVDLLRGHEVEPAGAAVLDLALALRITAYDAQFASVARDLGTRLVTSDRRLCRACPDLALPLESAPSELAGR